MGKISSVIAAIILCGVWGVSQAKADVCTSSSNIVQNCGFETGTFANWTIGGNTSGGTPNSYGVDNTNPNSGNYEAYFGAVGIPISLSQTLTTALPNERYQVSFYLDQNSQDTSGTYTHSFDVSFDGILLDSVSNAPYSNGYVKYTFTTATTGSGNSDVLKFDFRNDDAFFFLDDVSVIAQGPVVPEPASFLLVLPALGGVLALARRKRSVA